MWINYKLQITKLEKARLFRFAGAKLEIFFELCKQILSIFASIKINNVRFTHTKPRFRTKKKHHF